MLFRSSKSVSGTSPFLPSATQETTAFEPDGSQPSFAAAVPFLGGGTYACCTSAIRLFRFFLPFFVFLPGSILVGTKLRQLSLRD